MTFRLFIVAASGRDVEIVVVRPTECDARYFLSRKVDALSFSTVGGVSNDALSVSSCRPNVAFYVDRQSVGDAIFVRHVDEDAAVRESTCQFVIVETIDDVLFGLREVDGLAIGGKAESVWDVNSVELLCHGPVRADPIYSAESISSGHRPREDATRGSAITSLNRVAPSR